MTLDERIAATERSLRAAEGEVVGFQAHRIARRSRAVEYLRRDWLDLCAQRDRMKRPAPKCEPHDPF